jgi:hypothetical protein
MALSPEQRQQYEDELVELTSVDGWENHLFVSQQVTAARRALGMDEWAAEALATYVIISNFDKTLYWSNTDGWGDRETADTFTRDEYLDLNLPTEGIWQVTE